MKREELILFCRKLFTKLPINLPESLVIEKIDQVITELSLSPAAGEQEEKMTTFDLGDTIGFHYKGGRYVKGEVISISSKCITVKLQTDYIGKNDEWFVGENKEFNKSEMKKVSKQ